MNRHEVTRSQRPATAEERERLRRYREQIERELPQLRERARQVEQEKRDGALAEPIVSGQLRRVIAESGLDHRQLAQQAGLSPKSLAEFLVGITLLSSDEIDKLAGALRQELKPMVGT
jgi:hypothetical protein